jgi:phospholipid/cholesterol/gamma-HCH transport system substrate-binding protein
MKEQFTMKEALIFLKDPGMCSLNRFFNNITVPKIRIMETHSNKFKLRLGLFIAGGLILFILGIFFIGKQKNMFNPVFALSASFYNISGLQTGNNIRFSGINVGTVDKIVILNDSTVKVNMLIRKDVKQFIKSDCRVTIGSEGIIGDRILTISQGSAGAALAKEGQQLESDEPMNTDAIMLSLQNTAGNAEVITQQLAEIMTKINSGSGTLGKLIQDSTIARNLDQTIVNLKKSSKGLDENMEAAKHNFLLKGYYNKKAKAAAQKKEDAAEKKEDAAKEKEDQKEKDAKAK